MVNGDSYECDIIAMNIWISHLWMEITLNTPEKNDSGKIVLNMLRFWCLCCWWSFLCWLLLFGN